MTDGPPSTKPRPAPESDPQGTPALPPRWPALLLPLFVLVALFAWQQVLRGDPPAEEAISYTRFYGLVEQKQVESVTLTGRRVSGKLRTPVTIATEDRDRRIETFTSELPAQEDPALLPLLRESGAEVHVTPSETGLFAQILMAILPWVLIIGIWVWISRRAQKAMTGAGSPLSGVFKSSAKRFEPRRGIPVRYGDVAGHESAKRDLMEVVEFLREPARFRRLGARAPRGTLLVGPPGTGKTLLARAVAGEAGVPFFSITGSEFIELFVGVGASRVRDLFAQAKKVAPAIVFIDEIDAVGRSRGTGLGGGNDEREQTLNQLLSEMDGFTRTDDVVVLAATNRPDVLDPALLRPGRFDRRVLLDRPERAARLAILKVHVRDKPLAADVELDVLAQDSPGLSGAELANLANEAALNATRRNQSEIGMTDFRHAYDKIVLGDPRETRLGPEEKRRVAVHESGHAVVARFAAHAARLRRITIIPRGMSLGATQQAMDEDRHIATREELMARLQVLMGGYASEKLVTGEVSTGAENDLKRATEMAHHMVAHYGMSDRVGPVYHEHRTEHPFLGQKLAMDSGVSDETVHLIEDEARRLLVEAEKQAERIIQENRPAFDRLVEALVDRETLEQDDLDQVLDEPPPASERRPAAVAR
jgi:cell division protease FtsH